ncbi:protein moonraker-like isoform X2 [Mytilus galloprovincialis]|uniref:protein moonraker-like isoform X2 n=1 Tax=Mytilus galloprovincialis TaxID=29158 RepID=UPI003F7C8FFF
MYSSNNAILHSKASVMIPGQNQLLFNLDAHPQPYKSAVQFYHPRAIVLDKGGPMAPDFQHINQRHLNESSQSVTGGMNFSSLSEDRLSLAVKLAQRDLRKKKERSQQRSRSPSPKGKTRIIPGKRYWDKQQAATNKSRQMKIKEHDKNRHPRDARTQTPPRMQQNRAFPATTNSPPSRDTDFKLYPVKRSAPIDQPAKEIERLQREMEGYLQQIQVIEQRVLRDQNVEFLQPSKSRKKDGYLPQEEDAVRKKLRSEETATRAARQMYVLRQQVRQIQQELTKTGTDKTKHTKKSQAMARLAAAHRYAVRTIQAFVTNLPNTDLHSGLPSSYHELALLIRQMSLLSTQLSSDGKSTVQEDLVKMLDRVDELNKAWCVEVTKPPVIETTQEEVTSRRRKSPVSRQLPQPSFRPTPHRGKENKPVKGVLKKPAIKRSNVQKQQVAWNTGTPERKAMLRAGIEALMDTSDVQQGKAGMAWNVPLQEEPVRKPASKTSLILPGRLQNQRIKAQRAVKQVQQHQQQQRSLAWQPQRPALSKQTSKPHYESDPDVHYRDPTLSSSLKALDARDRSLSPYRCDRSFSAPPSPSSERGHSPWIPSGKPKGHQRRSRSQSPYNSYRYLDLDGSDIVKSLFQGGHESRPRTRGGSPDRNLSLSERMVRDAEKKIQARLKPLLQKAEIIAFQQEEKTKTKRRQMADKALASFEDSGDDLTNMILGEVLDDTAKEYQRLERDEHVHREAVTMQDNPTLENIYQRLEQMEMESHNIRRRWATVHFEDVKLTTKVINNPIAPFAMEISKSKGPVIQEKPIEYNKDNSDVPIIFTKTKGLTLVKNRVLELDDLIGVESDRQAPPTFISLSDEVMRGIYSSQEAFDRHLKKTSHHPLGRFDPWVLAEEVSNLILEECLKDIAGELEDTNDAIMNQVCKAEFMVGNVSQDVESLPETKTTTYETDQAKITTYETGPISSPNRLSPVHRELLSPHRLSPLHREMVSQHQDDSVSFNVDEQYSEDAFEEDDSEENEDVTDDVDEDDDDDDDEN